VDALPQLMHEDGRIHTTFNQALTTTGRLSSIEPNLQNIPIRTERGARIRKAFIAEKNNSLLSVDYSQIELRILAHYSKDKNMAKAFHDDLDIHTATAAEVFSVSLKEVTGDMRRTAKAVNFGIAYGQGVFGLAENLGVSRTEASDIIKKYFARFPGVDEYIQSTIQLATGQGYVETLYGRRRYIEELSSSSPAIKKFGERAAINAPIQGTASDIVKSAMITVAQKINVPMILQVHDELIFEGTKSELEKNLSEIKSIMENVVQLSVPLKVNTAIGINWDEAH
jgi:DNA polymerase I